MNTIQQVSDHLAQYDNSDAARFGVRAWVESDSTVLHALRDWLGNGPDLNDDHDCTCCGRDYDTEAAGLCSSDDCSRNIVREVVAEAIASQALAHADDHGYELGAADLDMVETGVDEAVQSLGLSWSFGLRAAAIQQVRLQMEDDSEPDEDDVAEWVGLHYRVNYSAESAAGKAEWRDRYKQMEAWAAEDGGPTPG